MAMMQKWKEDRKRSIEESKRCSPELQIWLQQAKRMESMELYTIAAELYEKLGMSLKAKTMREKAKMCSKKVTDQ